MNPFAFIATGFKAFTAYMGWAQKRQDLNNTAPMQANAGAKTDQQIKDTAAKEVSTGDLAQIRKDAAE